jgi:tetratricopeptide (TPR) repeat protein
LANNLLQNNNPNEAIKYFDKAIEENPQNVYAYYGKGICLCKIQEHEEAIKWYFIKINEILFNT